jgi:hypothetical protein
MTEGRQGGREEKNKNFRVSGKKKVFRFSVFAFGVLIRWRVMTVMVMMN